MSLSLGIGLGLTMQGNGNWWDDFRAGGFTPELIADFANDRYYNGITKTFSDLFTESGTTRDSDGIHIGIGDTLRLDAGSEPFSGFDGSEGTFVLIGNWVHNNADTAYILAGDSNTRFAYQIASNPKDTFFFDGSNNVTASGLFTDNTDIALVMSYLEGGNFNILADGSSESSSALTGNLNSTIIDVGNLAGTKQMNGYIRSIVYYSEQLPLTTRQGFSV